MEWADFPSLSASFQGLYSTLARLANDNCDVQDDCTARSRIWQFVRLARQLRGEARETQDKYRLVLAALQDLRQRYEKELEGIDGAGEEQL
uniref:ARAD1D01034p n=1 Tax=Blastobotrys adeninivorans TaxID=409370 RepID=A0A060TCN4_BLAAD